MPLLTLALIPDSFLAPVSIGFTVAVVCFLLYWVVVAIGLIDHDTYDGSADSVAGLMLHFFFGHAPPLLVMSLAALVAWVAAVSVAPTVAEWADWKQILLDLPLLAGGMLVARLIAFPVGRVYQRARDEEKAEQEWSPVGMLARVVSHEVSDAHGQIEVNKGGPTVLLSARAKPGCSHRKGEVVKVLSRDGGSGYLVGPPDASA